MGPSSPAAVAPCFFKDPGGCVRQAVHSFRASKHTSGRDFFHFLSIASASASGFKISSYRAGHFFFFGYCAFSASAPCAPVVDCPGDFCCRPSHRVRPSSADRKHLATRPTTSSPSIPRCHIGFPSGFSLVSVYLILIALLDSRATPPATATTDRIHDDRSHSGSADDPLQTLDARYLKIVVPPPNKRRAD